MREPIDRALYMGALRVGPLSIWRFICGEEGSRAEGDGLDCERPPLRGNPKTFSPKNLVRDAVSTCRSPFPYELYSKKIWIPSRDCFANRYLRVSLVDVPTSEIYVHNEPIRLLCYL